MIRKNGRRKRATLYFHVRNNGKCHDDRTTPKSRNIINDCYFLLMIMIFFHTIYYLECESHKHASYNISLYQVRHASPLLRFLEQASNGANSRSNRLYSGQSPAIVFITKTRFTRIYAQRNCTFIILSVKCPQTYIISFLLNKTALIQNFL